MATCQDKEGKIMLKAIDLMRKKINDSHKEYFLLAKEIKKIAEFGIMIGENSILADEILKAINDSVNRKIESDEEYLSNLLALGREK